MRVCICVFSTVCCGQGWGVPPPCRRAPRRSRHARPATRHHPRARPRPMGCQPTAENPTRVPRPQPVFHWCAPPRGAPASPPRPLPRGATRPPGTAAAGVGGGVNASGESSGRIRNGRAYNVAGGAGQKKKKAYTQRQRGPSTTATAADVAQRLAHKRPLQVVHRKEGKYKRPRAGGRGLDAPTHNNDTPCHASSRRGRRGVNWQRRLQSIDPPLPPRRRPPPHQRCSSHCHQPSSTPNGEPL